MQEEENQSAVVIGFLLCGISGFIAGIAMGWVIWG